MAVWQFLLMMVPVAVGMGCAVWLWGKDDSYRREKIKLLMPET